MELDDAIVSGAARILAYGTPKTRKTWWAGTAAEAGFNVVLFDCDDGYHILRNLSPEARKRVKVIRGVDRQDGPVAAVVMTYLMKGEPFYFEEATQRCVTLPLSLKADSEGNLQGDVLKIETRKFDTNTVLIIDSWTALAFSVMFRFCQENNIDLSDAEKFEWDGYRWAGMLLSWYLARLNSLNCHVVVIGHVDNFEKKTGKGDNQKVVFSRIQPKSVSGPHGMQLAKNFSDVLYFESAGKMTYIDTNSDSSRDGGARHINPGRYPFSDFKFSNFCQQAGLHMPSGDTDWNGFEKLPAGSLRPGMASKVAGPTTSDGAAASVIPGSSGVPIKIGNVPTVAPSTPGKVTLTGLGKK